MDAPKHSAAAVKAHPAPVRKNYKSGAEYAEACLLVNEARTEFDAPSHPLMLNGKDWNKALVMDHICDQLATTSSGIGAILKRGFHGKTLPSYSSIMAWLDSDETLLDRYTRAKEAQADFMADEMLTISDEGGVEPVLVDGIPLLAADGNPVMSVSNAAVQHAKLRVETRKWLAGKLKPKKYGDRLNLDAEVKVSDLPDEQVEAKLLALMAKAQGKT